MSSPQQILGQFIKNIFKIKRHAMFQVALPDQNMLTKTRIQINNKLGKYYKTPLLRQYFKSLPPKALLDQSVVMFVGSRTRPQNIPLRNELIQLAIEKAEKEQMEMIKKLKSLHPQYHNNTNIKHNQFVSQPKNKSKKNLQSTEKHTKTISHKQNQHFTMQDNIDQISIPNSQKYLARYYTHAFTKYEAMQKNEPQRWQSCAESIINMADKGHPLSSMLLAKDYYFRIDSQELSRQKKSQLVIEAAQYFYQSVTPNNLNGLYYIGEMLTQYPELNQFTTVEEIQELYIYAAANGNPLAYAKLAKMHKDKGDVKLYLKYLKNAAQGGCIEAQFNLGEEYRLGLNLKKDQVKAFAWFKHAGAHGFVYGKFNEAMMLYHGSECGRIKKNVKAALLQFEEIQRSNTIDVSAEIDEIMKKEQIIKQLEQAMKQQEQEKRINDKKSNVQVTQVKSQQKQKK